MTLKELQMRARYVLAACIVLVFLALALESPVLLGAVGFLAALAALAWVLAAVADAAVNTKKEN